MRGGNGRQEGRRECWCAVVVALSREVKGGLAGKVV